MLTSLCALTLNVMEVGKEIWTELFKVISDAADAEKRVVTAKGTTASTVSSIQTKILVTCDLERLICLFR